MDVTDADTNCLKTFAKCQAVSLLPHFVLNTSCSSWLWLYFTCNRRLSVRNNSRCLTPTYTVTLVQRLPYYIKLFIYPCYTLCNTFRPSPFHRPVFIWTLMCRSRPHNVKQKIDLVFGVSLLYVCKNYVLVPNYIFLCIQEENAKKVKWKLY